MRQKFLTGAVFALLVVAGALTASAVAGKGPLRAQQTTTVTGPTTTDTTTTTTVTTATTTDTTTTTTPAPPRRVTICHHARAKNGATRHITVRILRRAWSAHQRHGDSVGGCRTATARKFHNRTAHKKRWHKPPRRR